MSAKVTLDAKGLVLSPGELSRASGSLTLATNVNVEAPGIIRSRQGFAKQATGVGGPGWKMISTKELGANLLVNYGTQTAATSLKYGDGTAGWTAISGTVTNQPATRMQCAVGRRNHYVTSDEGVRRIESNYGMTFAGMPNGLALDVTGVSGAALTLLTGTGGFLADTESVAYRVTWCRKDAQGVVIEGAPSSRTVIYNNTRTSGWATGVAKNVVMRVRIPKQVLTASTDLTVLTYFYRVYRSAAEIEGVEPSDDMRLVAEGVLGTLDISGGYKDIIDSTIELYRERAPVAYFSTEAGSDVGANGLRGISQSNAIPPRARDAVLYADCAFFSDFMYLYNLDLNLLSTVAADGGLEAGDTITIASGASSEVFTAIAPGTPLNNQFVVVTVAAGASLFESLERTAQNLVEAINRSTTNTIVWAYYVADPDGLPGKFRIEKRVHSDTTSFTVVASGGGGAFRPPIETAVTALNDVQPNGFVFSKPNLPDAVPLVNRGTVGPAATTILRMVVLGESIYFFTDAGLYRLTGRSVDDFAVYEFDLTFRLRGREMVTVCDEAIYAWGIEGIAKITQAGVQYISNSIEPLVQKVVSEAQAVSDPGSTWLAKYGWAASYRARHKVLFAVPNSGTNGNCPTVYVYDTRMEAWTTWAFTAGGDVGVTWGHSAGVARVSDDFLHLAQWNSSGADAYTYKERLAYAATDFRDDTVDASNVVITKTVQWNAAASAPELATHWDELHALFDVSPTFSAWTTPTAATVVFTADRASASDSVSLAPTATSRMSRCLVPLAQRRSTRLTVRVTHATAEYFGLEGMVLVHRPGESTATVRT